MSDDSEHSTSTESKSWFERLSQAMIREPQDRNQLVEVLRDAEERDLLEPEALTMMEGVLQVTEMRVRDIMIPRSQMVSIVEGAKLDEILPVVIESAHSRFPVLNENKDEIIGVMLAKDLLGFAFKLKEKPFELKNILRKPVFVPESKRLDTLLKEFRVSHNHMALVIDEYGGIAGLVTIEDVLEQIVGEIEDEHDEEEFNIKKHSDNQYIIKALTPIEDFNEFFEDQLSDEDYDTVGGLVLREFGQLPEIGATVSFGRYDFKVLNADKRRVHLLEVTVN